MTLVTVLLFTFCGTSADARASSSDEVKSGENTSNAAPAIKEGKSNEKLRTDILKLVADAKAGRVAAATRPQTRPPQSKPVERDKDCDRRRDSCHRYRNNRLES